MHYNCKNFTQYLYCNGNVENKNGHITLRTLGSLRSKLGSSVDFNIDNNIHSNKMTGQHLSVLKSNYHNNIFLNYFDHSQ